MKRRIVLACALAAVTLFATSSTISAHGDMHAGHGAPKPIADAVAISAAGYAVALESDPSPLAVGRESRIIANVTRADSHAPARDGHVEIVIDADRAEATALSASESTWAGRYTATYTPTRAGGAHARVIVHALDGRHLAAPLTFDFPLDIARAPGLGWPAWSAIALALVIAGVFVYAASLRARTSAVGAFDLLSIPWLHRTLTSRALQSGVQIAMLAVTLVIVLLGFFDVQDGGVNLATKLTWTIWWPGIIFTFVLVGRVWCIACPFGALNEWSARASGARRQLPRIFRNVWWATAAFVLLTWADEQLGIVRSPAMTAWIVVGVAAIAIAIGLRYERRSFCRHLCPIGGLIGIYSMTAPVELRARDRALCRTHADQACYRGSVRNSGCPMFEFPATLDRNTYCTLCGDCVRGCEHGNVVLRLRAFGKDLWASTRRALDEAYLAVALVGITLTVTAGMLTWWPGWISALARWLPEIVRTHVKPITYLGAVESAVLFVGSLAIVPLLVFAAGALSVWLARDETVTAPHANARRAFVIFGYMFVPIGLAMHLAHNLSHLLLEGGGFLPALQRAALRFTPWSLGEPDWSTLPLAPEPVVALLQTIVLIGFLALSLYAGHRLALRTYTDARAASRAVIPFAALSLAFTVLGIVLLSQPMAMRHGS
jgi:polyferredoxin